MLQGLHVGTLTSKGAHSVLRVWEASPCQAAGSKTGFEKLCDARWPAGGRQHVEAVRQQMLPWWAASVTLC